ncbi:hypothetical protein EPO33_03430 [Patescibacteria group bacterium]|nr:MAG: hypothetical protein EPO33_03430 [Patescibacteria group bacterium]
MTDNLAFLLHKFLSRLREVDGDQWLRAFEKFLNKENPWPEAWQPRASPPRYMIWKTIQIGAHSRAELADLLRRHWEEQNKIYGEDRVEKMLRETVLLEDFEIVPSPGEIDLACVKAKDLGINSYGSRNRVVSQALGIGLALCPEEAAVRLALRDDLSHHDIWIYGKRHDLVVRSGRRNGCIRHQSGNCTKSSLVVFEIPRSPTVSTDR